MVHGVGLTYYGHSAFLFETRGGLRILVDPYGNRPGQKWFLRLFPDVACDLILITHEHFDHTGLDHLSAAAYIVRSPGVLQRGDVHIHGFADLHVQEGPQDLPNIMFRLDVGGLRFLHVGDNRPDIPSEVRDQFGEIDILMIPVDDSCHLLSFEEADHFIKSVAPKVVIPMHYFTPGLTSEESTLKPPDHWLSTQPAVRRFQTHQIQLAPKDLPFPREVWLLQVSPDSLASSA